MRNDIALREFHVSRNARDRYQFDETLFALSGNVVFANFYAARIFAQKMNDQRDLISFPERAVRAGQINALGLIDEMLHLCDQSLSRATQSRCAASKRWLTWNPRLAATEVDAALRTFTATFPPVSVYQGQETVESYLQGETGGTSHREVALEELLLLWLANNNPPLHPSWSFSTIANWHRPRLTRRSLASLDDFFETQPRFGPENQTLLVALLHVPAHRAPDSLQAQLDFLREFWADILGVRLLCSAAGQPRFHCRGRKALLWLWPRPVEPYVCRHRYALKPKRSAPIAIGCPDWCSSPKTPTSGWIN